MKRLLLVLSLIIFTLPLMGETFEEQLARYRDLKVEEFAYNVTDGILKSGNSQFTMNGIAAPVMAGEEIVGFVFSGNGVFDLTIAEGPFRQGNLTTLFEKYSLKPDKNDVLSDKFDKLLIITNQIPEGLLKGDHVPPAGLSEFFAKQVKRLKASYYGFIDHDIIKTSLNPSEKPEVYALMEGGRADSAYYGEPNYENQEFYGDWKKSMGVHYIRAMVQQPVHFDGKKRPDALFYQTGLELEIVSEDNVFTKEKMITQITSAVNGLNLLEFGFLNGRSKGRTKLWNDHTDPITVTSVTDMKGNALPFSHRYSELLVKLPSSLKRAETFSLIVKAEGNLLKNYAGDAYLVLGNFLYFPQADLTKMHTPFHSVVKVKDPYIALGTGKTVKRWKEGDLNCLESFEKNPISFPFLVVGDFQVSEKKNKDFDVKVYSYVMGKDKAGKKLAKNGLSILDFYSNGMIKFPYEELEVVEIPYQRHFFWQAPSGVTEITSEAFNPIGGSEEDLDTILRRLFSQGQNARYAHELAHQWFGNLVSMHTYYDNWLSESFAEYLCYMFMKDGAKDKKKAAEVMKSWELAAKECGDKGSVYGASSAGQYYTCLLYGKGPYVLHALHQEIGEENFNRALKIITKASYEKQMKAITEDYILIVNHVTGKDYRPFFDKYIYGTETPVWKKKK